MMTRKARKKKEARINWTYVALGLLICAFFACFAGGWFVARELGKKFGQTKVNSTVSTESAYVVPADGKVLLYEL